MQIKIEIDVKPEELRRFLGLPDVAGLQEDLVNFLRDKLGAAAESFDPASFVKENLQSLKASAPWQLIVSAAKSGTRAAEPVVKKGARRVRRVIDGAPAAAPAKAAPKRKKPAARKKAAAKAEPASG